MPTSPVPSLPMYFPPATTGFDLPTAQTCAALVVIAYQQFTVWSDLGYPKESKFASNTTWQQGGPQGFSYSAPIWSYFKILDIPFSEPIGFVAWTADQQVYVVFRGTMTHADDVIDAEIDQTAFKQAGAFGQVHVGFWDVYTGLEKALKAAVAAHPGAVRLIFTGHSMGGALSALATADIATNAAPAGATLQQYTFAGPRAGDLTFAAALNGSAVASFRVVNTEDVVPAVPPAVTGSILYQHFGYPVDFSAQYKTIGGNHSMIDCYAYAINHPQQPLNPKPTPLQNIVTGRGIGTGLLPQSLVVG